METVNLLIKLLTCALIGTVLNEQDKQQLDEQTLNQIYKIAKKHDMAHLLSTALKKNSITVEAQLEEKFNKAQLDAVNRYLRIDMDKERIFHILNTAQINHIPLKGTIIREMYPEQWMRTSCDIDILIKPQDISAVQNEFFGKLGFKPFAQTSNRDISFATPSGVHIELHHTLLEDENKVGQVLEKVWEYSNPSKGNAAQYEMAPEFFIMYIVSHAARHVTVGGCGIRPIYDLYFILNKMSYNKNILDELLETVGLKTFFGVACELMNGWIKNEPMGDTALSLQEYILSGGTYGSYENYISACVSGEGGKRKYLRKRFFMPIEDIKNRYPNVVKHPYLLNWYRLCRLCRAVIDGKTKRGIKEIKSSLKTPQDNAVGLLLSKLELNEIK